MNPLKNIQMLVKNLTNPWVDRKRSHLETRLGFESELEFWDRELSLEGLYPENIRNRIYPENITNEFPIYTLPVIQELTRLTNHPPKVLDVGSGPLSMFGYAAFHNLIELTAVDPLADQYQQFIDKHGYRLINYELRQCAGENLSRTFAKGRFDIVWIHNALDHCQDPRKVMREMVHVLKTGGYFYYQGWSREGTAEKWFGLHQHDIFLAAGYHLMCTSRTRRNFLSRRTQCLDSGLPLEVVEHSEPTMEVKQWVKIVWRKIH
jgi:SAM-dependent methyltransferase